MLFSLGRQFYRSSLYMSPLERRLNTPTDRKHTWRAFKRLTRDADDTQFAKMISEMTQTPWPISRVISTDPGKHSYRNIVVNSKNQKLCLKVSASLSFPLFIPLQLQQTNEFNKWMRYKKKSQSPTSQLPNTQPQKAFLYPIHLNH